MARKRIIDPEFWSDEEIGQWTCAGRLFYIACWNFADDAGVLKAHSSLLKSQIFPYDLRIDIEELKEMVSKKILWYSVSGSQYGFVKNFLKHQRIDRPSPSKLPIPPQINEDSTNTRGVVLPNTTKDNISEVNISKPSFDFESIWNKYPKRVGKKESIRHFKSQVRSEEDYKNIIIALENYLKSERVAKGYIQNGSTWFNNWQDWVEFKETMCPKCKGNGKYTSSTGYEIICDCPKGKKP